jgi:hypothetical protein
MYHSSLDQMTARLETLTAHTCAHLAAFSRMLGFKARKRLHVGFTIMFWLWIGFHGPLRSLALRLGASGDGFLAVAPSLFAGGAATLGAFMSGLPRPVPAALCGATFVIAIEMLQPWMRRYTFDPGDIVAGAIGATLAVPLLWWHKRSTTRRRGGIPQ